MINKTRKHIWPVSLVMSIAIIGALAAFLVLASNPGDAQAHGEYVEGEDHCPRIADGIAHAEGTFDHTCDEGPTQQEDNEDPVAMEGVLPDVKLLISTTSDPIDVSAAFDDPDAGDTLTYTAVSDNSNVASVAIIDGVLTIVAGSSRGSTNITVTAADGNGGTASVTFMVTVVEIYTLTADPMRDAMLPPPPTDPNVVDPYAGLRQVSPSAIFVVTTTGAYTAKFNLGVVGSKDDVTVTITASANDGITIEDSDGLIGAGFKDDEERDLEGSLTIKATDAGSRAFEIEGSCDQVGVWAYIVVEDKDLDNVAEGAVLCKEAEAPPPPDDVITAAECYSVTGYMGDDEDEAMDQLRDDIEPHARPAHPTNPEMGQDTIEILEGSADVQITVTSCEAGPVYIRFLDSDGDVFGTDIDECETCEGASGADVVGLDSQQKLELNLGPTDMDAAMALMYDQYNVVTPGSGADKYLVGKAGMYHQGTFRFIAPCDWEPFEVEIYEKDGKVLRELENGMFSQTISCVPSAPAWTPTN